MIFGIGVDLIEFSRGHFLKNLYDLDLFAKKILNEDETILMRSKGDFIRQRKFALKAFCAKEAISKALGVGIGSSFSFKDVSVLRGERGCPYVKFYKNFNIGNTKITLSDTDIYCVCFVTIESQK